MKNLRSKIGIEQKVGCGVVIFMTKLARNLEKVMKSLVYEMINSISGIEY